MTDPVTPEETPKVEGNLLDDKTETDQKETTTDQVAATTDVKLSGHDPMTVPKKFIDEENGEFQIQELINSYTELEKSSNARAPESYDFEKVFEEHSLAFENDEQQKETVDLFKKHRLSQEAVNDLLAVYGARQNSMMEHMGPGIDRTEQYAHLQKAWGNQTEAKRTELNDFIEAKGFPPEVLTNSPMQTAAGLQLLYEMMKGTKGPNVIQDSVVSVEDLQAQMNEVIAHPNYHNNMAPDHKSLQQKASKIAERMLAQKR